MPTDFGKKVFLEVRKIPAGNVSTYALVAQAIGQPSACRAVGNALNKNCKPGVPCHRVVRSDGTIGGFARGTEKKIEMLRGEGIRIIRKKIEDMDTFLFAF